MRFSCIGESWLVHCRLGILITWPIFYSLLFRIILVFYVLGLFMQISNFSIQQWNKGKLDNREKRTKINNHMGNIFNALDRGWIIKDVYLPHFEILYFKLNLLSIAVLKSNYMHSVCRFSLDYLQLNCITLIAIMNRQNWKANLKFLRYMNRNDAFEDKIEIKNSKIHLVETHWKSVRFYN